MIDRVYALELLAYQPFAPVLILIVIVAVMACAIVILAQTIGPKRHGPVKDDTYESAMPVVANARQRFNVRFYIVAMLFLLFDVEVVFMWPWALLFRDTASAEPAPFARQMVEAGYGKGFLLAEMAVFVVILLVGYVYAWRKGVFKWN
jgi:NADH-quinone oxidoreductase subunit A